MRSDWDIFDLSQIKNVLVEARRERGFSQRALAARVGRRSGHQISNFETTKGGLWDSLVRRADALGIRFTGEIGEWKVDSLDKVPEIFAKVRETKGLDFWEMGRLVKKPGYQIRIWESQSFQRCRVATLVELVDALGLSVRCHIKLDGL